MGCQVILLLHPLKQGRILTLSSSDLKNKTIGVIGGGSSAIQIVPDLQKLPGVNLKCFVRSKTWISQPFGEASMKKLGLSEITCTSKGSGEGLHKGSHRF